MPRTSHVSMHVSHTTLSCAIPPRIPWSSTLCHIRVIRLAQTCLTRATSHTPPFHVPFLPESHGLPLYAISCMCAAFSRTGFPLQPQRRARRDALRRARRARAPSDIIHRHIFTDTSLADNRRPRCQHSAAPNWRCGEPACARACQRRQRVPAGTVGNTSYHTRVCVFKSYW